MKKLLPVLVFVLLLAGCSVSTQSGPNFTKTTENVNSPYEGYTIREGKFIVFDLLDWGRFDDADQYATCKADKSLRGSDACPIFSIVSFSPTDGKLMEEELYPSDVELFEDEDREYIDLGCYSPEDEEYPALIYTSSFDESVSADDDYYIMDSDTEDEVIDLIDSNKVVKVKLTKTPYNMAEDHNWGGCESLISKIEIIK